MYMHVCVYICICIYRRGSVRISLWYCSHQGTLYVCLYGEGAGSGSLQLLRCGRFGIRGRGGNAPVASFRWELPMLRSHAHCVAFIYVYIAFFFFLLARNKTQTYFFNCFIFIVPTHVTLATVFFLLFQLIPRN